MWAATPGPGWPSVAWHLPSQAGPRRVAPRSLCNCLRTTPADNALPAGTSFALSCSRSITSSLRVPPGVRWPWRGCSTGARWPMPRSASVRAVSRWTARATTTTRTNGLRAWGSVPAAAFRPCTWTITRDGAAPSAYRCALYRHGQTRGPAVTRRAELATMTRDREGVSMPVYGMCTLVVVMLGLAWVAEELPRPWNGITRALCAVVAMVPCWLLVSGRVAGVW
jgi:hypothetical protein